MGTFGRTKSCRITLFDYSPEGKHEKAIVHLVHLVETRELFYFVFFSSNRVSLIEVRVEIFYVL